MTEMDYADEPLMIEHDIRDLLLGYEEAQCPCCEGTMIFEQPGDIVEAHCDNLSLSNANEDGCYLIYTNFEKTKPKEGSLEEWMELYQNEPEPNVAVKVRRIVAWWQQADKPWRGHDAQKDANEIALDAIQNLDELWKD